MVGPDSVHIYKMKTVLDLDRDYWLKANDETVDNLDDVLQNISDYNIALVDYDRTIAKNPTIDAIKADLIKNRIPFRWFLKSLWRSCEKLSDYKLAFRKNFEDFYEHFLKANQKRRKDILEYSTFNPPEFFPGVIEYFEMFRDRNNVLLSNSIPEITIGAWQLPIEDRVCNVWEKDSEVQKILERYDLENPTVLVFGDSSTFDKKVKLAVEEFLGENGRCYSFKICSRKNHADPDFNFSMGQNWLPLYDLLNKANIFK